MRSRSTPTISEEPVTGSIRDCVRYGSMAGAENAVKSGVPAPSRFFTRCAQTLEEWREGDGVFYSAVARAERFLGGLLLFMNFMQ